MGEYVAGSWQNYVAIVCPAKSILASGVLSLHQMFVKQILSIFLAQLIFHMLSNGP